ncbi:tRNA pseudouridine(38/39) synthase isoform X1 [Vigna radiata var. radiata]|uniref:tRNA pseudouridine(38/39) synthase isoform X1 n=1 Tax=Vigna radiata var. radiata TaxID=3916 RepID=A0A1S3V9D7_VIGRR|nr:tRNA pseudouridine(38/39) synthase isoform X1 [Vigna radiata var. radiata]
MATQQSDAELIVSLQARVKELETENAKLLAQLADCHSHEMEEKLHGPDGKDREAKEGNRKFEKKIEKKESGYDTRFMSHHSKRYVALKVMYFGKRFYGFASEAQMQPTVESELFKAFEKTRLLIGDKKESQYSRCGRTDKGVSSVGQVIALFLRSNLKLSAINNGNSGEVVLDEKHEGEIDYVRVLNRVLPNDIRILGWCPAPVDFHARFSCLSREYKYFFWKEKLNIPAMESAGIKLVGEHDFRNFCKMDAANVHNYRRHITLFDISPTDVRLRLYNGNQLWVIKIKGSAFLWHQVRCMVAVLFMVGKGFESPNVIDMLLDTTRIVRKPQYTMASEVPLVLQCCEFDDIKFICSSDAGDALRLHLVNECQMYHLQATIFHEALLNCVPLSNDQSLLPFQATKKKVSHVSLMSRPTEPSYEERRAKLNTVA